MYVVQIHQEGKKDRYLLRDHHYTQHRTTGNKNRAEEYSQANANKVAVAIGKYFPDCTITAVSNGEENS